MLINWKFISLQIIYSSCISLFHCDRVFDHIYEDLQSDLTCIKRLNGTSEVGCSSSFWGNVGVVHVIKNEDNFTWVVENGKYPPYMLAVIPEMFTVDLLLKAQQSKKVSGIVLLAYKKFNIPAHFSGEQSCPNQQNSLYINTSYEKYCDANPWNPFGSALLYMNWDFPVFLLNDDKSIESILSCYKKFNDPMEYENPITYPFCSMELTSNMYATVSSEVCLRRTSSLSPSILCEPLEDINIWGSLSPFENVTKEQSLVILSTSADSASLFSNISPGADAAISGIIILLLTAEALYKHQTMIKEKSNYNVLFTIFEGEAWNYIGSSRMVYDMVNDKFPNAHNKEWHNQINPVNLSHIHSIIELRQLGIINKNSRKEVYLHTDPISRKDEAIIDELENILHIFNDESLKFNLPFKKIENNSPLPPSSFQSFLKHKNISGIVITDHEDEFRNKYFLSVYDDAKNLNFHFNENGTSETDTLHNDMANIASIISSSLYKLLTGSDKNIQADKNTAKKLLYCFLRNMNCSYFQENSDKNLKNFLKPAPAKTFISVKRADSPLTVLTLRILSRYMGKEVYLNETECKSNNTQAYNLIYFPFIRNGTCIKTTVHHSSALSPAFVIKDYDWTSNKYSTWTESIWSMSKARIFLVPSPKEEILLLLCGCLSLFISLTVAYFVNSKADIIFINERPIPC